MPRPAHSGLNMRFKVSAPVSQLVANACAGAAGAAGGAGAGALGINVSFAERSLYEILNFGFLFSKVLFHGDGGQSFFDFPVRPFLLTTLKA